MLSVIALIIPQNVRQGGKYSGTLAARTDPVEGTLDLAATLGTSSELWLNLQMYFDLAKAEARRRRAS